MPRASVNPATTARLTPDERLSELAAILAAGLIRARLAEPAVPDLVPAPLSSLAGVEVSPGQRRS